MNTWDWLLVAVWLLTVGFIAPWLISAPSWIAVGLGFGLLIALVVITIKRVKFHYE
jgi:hypothetical protein